MPLAADDLAQFVDPDMPGHALATIGGQPVGVLFSNKPAEAFGVVAGNSPVARLPAAIAPAIDSLIQLHGITYRVNEVHLSDSGLATLVLQNET